MPLFSVIVKHFLFASFSQFFEHALSLMFYFTCNPFLFFFNYREDPVAWVACTDNFTQTAREMIIIRTMRVRMMHTELPCRQANSDDDDDESAH
jgi:hypothetical protein